MKTDQTDRMSLAAALLNAGARADPESLDRAHKKLWQMRRNYINNISKRKSGGGHRPSRELLNVNKALKRWLKPPQREGQMFTYEQVLIHGSDDLKIASINWLMDSTTRVIEQINDKALCRCFR